MIGQLDEPEQEQQGDDTTEHLALLLAYYESRGLPIDETSQQLESENAAVLVS